MIETIFFLSQLLYRNGGEFFFGKKFHQPAFLREVREIGLVFLGSFSGAKK